jgi:medium-chain acyl-[acyl-carrier-protein] hydrolase
MEVLGPDVEATYVQLPGRESRLREAPLRTVSALASELASELQPLLDRPYALFGHSLGGVVAFETIRELARRGAPGPCRLIVSASRAPHLPWPHPPLRDRVDLEMLAEVNRRYGGSVPRQVMESAELRGLFVPSLRADLGALETYCYAPGAPLAHPISAFAGSADQSVPASVVEPWRTHTTAPFRMRVIEGGHLFVQSAQRELIAAIREDLRVDTELAASDGGALSVRPRGR